MAPKDILTKEVLLEYYINKRLSVKTISELLDIKSMNSVTQALKRYGISRRSLKDSSHILTKEYLEEHYVNQNKSLKTIAEEIGFKRKSIVSNALKKHNIPQREHTVSHRMEESWRKKRKHHTISGSFFSSIVNGAKKRKIDITISINDIWDVFLKQEGKCALSGVVLKFNKPGENKNIRTASLDRINSEKGYTIDNIQWVHRDINKMKMDLSQEEFIDWCSLVYKERDKNK